MGLHEDNSEHSTNKQADNQSAKKILAGIVAVLCIVFGGFLASRLLHQSADTPSQLEEAVVGIVDMQELVKAHKDYDKLLALRQEAKVLEADLSAKHMVMEFKTPEAKKDGFDTAAQQKQTMDRITKFSHMMSEIKQAEKDKRAEMAPQFAAEIKQVEDSFLNRILNIRLKLDNADALRLTEEQQNQLLDELNDLAHQRGQAVMEVEASQEADIKAYVDGLKSKAYAEMQAFVAENDKLMAQKEAQKQAEAQKRNNDNMNQDGVTPVQDKIRIAKKKAALAGKNQEIKMLEKHIYKDIAGIAAKLAIMKHLTLIISNPADDLPTIAHQEGKFQVNGWDKLRLPVTCANTVDITDDMLEEIKNLNTDDK